MGIQITFRSRQAKRITVQFVCQATSILIQNSNSTMADKLKDTAMKKLQEGAHFHSSSDMNADMSTEAADMVVLAVDKYIPTQNWEVSFTDFLFVIFFLYIKLQQLILLRSFCGLHCLVFLILVWFSFPFITLWWLLFALFSCLFFLCWCRLLADLSKRPWTEGLVLLGTFRSAKVLDFRLLTSKGKCCT